MTLPQQGSRGCALVTGASSGIGSALAHELARRQWPLLLVSREPARLEQAAAALRARHGVRVETHACDLSDREERARLHEELRWREISVLCANAGFATCGPLGGADPARESKQIEVDVLALHELTLCVLAGMLARGAGAILLTGSNAGEQPVPTAATYAACKAFVNSFAQALHAELRGSGVSCTLLAPGPVRSGFARAGGVAHLEGKQWISWASPERVAREALAGLERERRIVIPGRMAQLQALAGRHLPRPLLFALLRGAVLPMLRLGQQGPAAHEHETPRA